MPLVSPGWAALHIAFLLAGLAEAQTLEWVKPAISTLPSARCCGAMTYDADTGSMVLFGGGISGLSYGDTWLFSPALGWSQLSPATSPPPRSGAGFAYDPISKTAVLFGGNPGNFAYLDDTWIWDGVTWTQQFPPVSPSARAFNTEQMVFDTATGKVVLFGGYAHGGSSFLGDTWEWDGKARIWTQRFPATSPSPRGTTLAYDAATRQVVIFGGEGGGLAYYNDTWTWDGITWTQQFPASSPSARTDLAMAYDATIGQVVLFGGLAYSGGYKDLNDTWRWNGTTWSQIQTTHTPVARASASMAYDPYFKGLFLFGGSTGKNNSSFTDTNWFFIRVR